MFSQNSEEQFILDRLKHIKNGKYIDIGAFHFEHLSNTRALYLNGWKGVLVEPQPENYEAIFEKYKDDHEMTVLNVAIGEGTKEIAFYESNGDAVGTTSEPHRDKWGAAGVKYSEIKVQQMDTVEFFNQYGKDCDFLSVDVEDTNLSLFRQIPDWVWERVKMVVIEHDNGIEEIEAKLHPMGFETVHINAENIILSKP